MSLTCYESVIFDMFMSQLYVFDMFMSQLCLTSYECFVLSRWNFFNVFLLCNLLETHL